MVILMIKESYSQSCAEIEQIVAHLLEMQCFA
jgi:hypothetical protein